MEGVLDRISTELGGLSGYSVVYRDSMGRWDGVRLDKGVVAFYSLGEADEAVAVARLLHPLP